MRRLLPLCIAALFFTPFMHAAPSAPAQLTGPLLDTAHWTSTGASELLQEIAKQEEALDPEDSRTLGRAGHVLLRAGKTQEAGALFQRAQASDPKDDEAFVQIAMAYSEAKMWAEADKWFALAVEKDPKDLDHTIEWGVSHWNRGEKEKAAQLFVKALRAEAKNARFYYKIGRGIQ